MRFARVLIGLLSLSVLFGCGGRGGHHVTTVNGAQFRVAWPQRSRDALQVPLTSALSARIVLINAGSGGANVTVNVDRDPAQTAAYVATYTIPQGITSRLSSINATFYSQPAEGGDVVGTATANATLTGSTVEFATIQLTGTITHVTASTATLASGSGDTQLTFSAMDAQNNVVAVSPGSAVWSIVDGNSITLTPDGIATPTGVGTTHVRVTVDGVTSDTVAVDVVGPTVTVYTWSGAKGGSLTTPSFSAVEGDKFQVTGGQNVVVTKLGHEIVSDTQPTSTVALFDANGNVIAQTDIPNTAEQSNGYYYKTINPVTLTAGSTYYIGALHGSGSTWNYYHGTNTATVPAFIADLGTWFKVTSTIDGGTWQSSGSSRHYVANFQAHQSP